MNSKENCSKDICWEVAVERFLAGLGNKSIRLIYRKHWKQQSIRQCCQDYDLEHFPSFTFPLTNLLHQEVLLKFGCLGKYSKFSKSGSLLVNPGDLSLVFIALFLQYTVNIIHLLDYSSASIAMNMYVNGQKKSTRCVSWSKLRKLVAKSWKVLNFRIFFWSQWNTMELFWASHDGCILKELLWFI